MKCNTFSILFRLRRAFLLLFALWIAAVSACTPLKQELSYEEPKIEDHRMSPYMTMREWEGVSYVSLTTLLNQAEYQWILDEKKKELAFGDTDILYKVRADDATALAAGQDRVSLTEAPIWRDGQLWMTPQAVDTLLGKEVRFHLENNHLVFEPSADPLRRFDENAVLPGTAGAISDFAEMADEDVRPFMKSADVDEQQLIEEARKYIGVEYEFGTAPYEQSKAFDCSSFVRHVFKQFGISLPRESRAQAAYGSEVSRENLKPGDLLFFYVPGRFRTNDTIGHVGIYTGGGKMIHASPEPKNGVQITDINKEYWKRTFVKAKRLI